MSKVSAWWSSVPFGTKFLFISVTVMYILDFLFGGYLLYLLANIPALTIKG